MLKVALYLIILTTSSATSHRQCCPTGTKLNLDFYECLGQPAPSTEEPGFPKCFNESAFVNRHIGDSKSLFKSATDLCVEQDIVVACVPLRKMPTGKLSLRKCCPMFTMATPDGCSETPESFSVNLTTTVGHRILNPGDIDIIPRAKCESKELLDASEYDVELLENGHLRVADTNNKLTKLKRDDFCMDRAVDYDGGIGIYFFACFGEQEEENPWVYVIPAMGLIVSIIFLTLTLIMYTCELKKQNLYGRTLMCHVGSTIVAFSFLAILQLQAIVKAEKPFEMFCETIIYAMIFSFLASFFWLNVMSIDIWRTFRRMRSRDSISQAKKTKRFIGYCTYAWGTPAIITGMTIGISHQELFSSQDEKATCGVERASYGYYCFFIAPIAAIIICNLVLYIITTWRCHQVKREIRKMHDADKTRNDRFFKKRDQLVLNVKLFVCMGITWSAEVIAFLLRDQSDKAIWYFTDALNALYGLIIFIIFACKEKKIRSLTRRISQWVDRRRFGSEYMRSFRKISTSINPSSTVSTSCMDSGITSSTQIDCKK